MLNNRVAVFGLVLVISGLVSSGVAKEKLYTLESVRTRGQIDKVSVSMDVKGKLRFTEDTVEDQEVETVPMELSGKAVYFERAIALSNEPKGHSRAARAYESMDTTIKVAGTKQEPKLRPERQLIGVQLDGQRRTLFSPEGELTRQELELIETPVDSLLLDRLLPSKPVALGATWEVPEETTAIFTGLDRIKDGRLLCKLTEIDAKRALVEIRGQVEGANKGVGSTFRVKAKYRFDRHSNRIDWLGLVFEEKSDIGHVEAGGTAIAKLQAQIVPQGEDADAELPESVREKLSDEAVSKMTLHANGPLTQLTFIPKQGNWHLTHDRRWYECGNDLTVGVLRFVDRGDLIAQCNVATIETVDPKKLPTLEQYQANIQKALGENFGQFLSAAQRANDQDYRVYKVVVQGLAGKGTSAELPIQWHYYLIADRHGRQVALTFTVEPDLLERLGEEPQHIVDTVRFGENLAAVSGESVKK